MTLFFYDVMNCNNVNNAWDIWKHKFNDACDENAPIKGCEMGTLFVLVSPCFRENVVVTCKIESFLCSLHNLRNCLLFWK